MGGGEKRASPIPLILVLDHPNSYPTLCIRTQLNEFQLSLILSHTVVSIPGDLLSVGRQKTTTTVPALNSKPVKWACLRREESVWSPQTASAFFSLPFLPWLGGSSGSIVACQATSYRLGRSLLAAGKRQTQPFHISMRGRLIVMLDASVGHKLPPPSRDPSGLTELCLLRSLLSKESPWKETALAASLLV